MQKGGKRDFVQFFLSEIATAFFAFFLFLLFLCESRSTLRSMTRQRREREREKERRIWREGDNLARGRKDRTEKGKREMGRAEKEREKRGS